MQRHIMNIVQRPAHLQRKWKVKSGLFSLKCVYKTAAEVDYRNNSRKLKHQPDRLHYDAIGDY